MPMVTQWARVGPGSRTGAGPQPQFNLVTTVVQPGEGLVFKRAFGKLLHLKRGREL